MTAHLLGRHALQLALVGSLFLALPAGLHAAPEIHDAHLNDFGEIVLKGVAFGQGPTVALYDDFSDIEILGESVNLKPQVGSWFKAQSTSSVPFIDEEHGNTSLFVRGDGVSQLEFGVNDNSGPHGLKTFQEVYLSYTIKDLGDFPGPGGTMTEFSTQSATKDAWMMFGNRGDHTGYAVSIGEVAGHDLFIPGWTGGGFNIAGNNTRLTPSYWPHDLRQNWAFGDWNTKMFHAELDPQDPYGDAEGFFSFLNKNAYHVNFRNGNFMEDQRSEGVPYAVWDRIKFFVWMRLGDADVNRVVDEIYVAIGDNANARVLLTNNDSLENSTRVFHLPPTSWTNSEIIAHFPDYLPGGRIYYLHVLDANNATSESLSLCQGCPNPPLLFPVQ